VERSLWVAVGALVAGQVPDYQRLIARAGQQHVWVFERGREGGDPSRVALKGAFENELFRHLHDVAQSVCDFEFARNIEEYSAWAGSVKRCTQPH
jgi:hypothetical protein